MSLNLILNPDVVALNPSTLAADLLELVPKFGNDKICYANTDYVTLRAALCGAKGPKFNVSAYMLNHFQPLRLAPVSSPLLIVAPQAAVGLSPTGLIQASTESSVSVGARGTSYGRNLDFTLGVGLGQATDLRSALMVSEVAHCSMWDFKRWFFIKHFNDLWSRPHSADFKIVDQHEHCSHGNENPCRDSCWVHASWVGRTKGNENSARFRPGIRFGGEKYMRLAAHVLLAAYANLLFTQRQQDKYVVDTGVLVGAAGGKPTQNVQIYITPYNEIHIRPSEHAAHARRTFNFPLDR